MKQDYKILEDQDQFDSVLNKGMFYANSFINKYYLINLHEYPVVEADPAEKSDDYIRLFKVARIVYDKDENANDKLISVYSALYNIQSSYTLIIKSHDQSLDFYIGIRSKNNASTAEEILNESLNGNFPGSVTKHIEKKQITNILSSITDQNRFGYTQNVASVSVVPSTRDKDKKEFVQGIEKFIDTMRGQDDYTAVFIAEPISKPRLEQRKQGLLSLQSTLSPFQSVQLSYGVNESDTVTKGMSASFTKSVNESLTDTTSTSKGTNKSKNRGWSFGLLGMGINGGHSTGYSEGSSWAKAVTKGNSSSTSKSANKGESHSKGDTRTITLTNQNKSVQYVNKKIEKHLERIKNCESFGMWDVACYFVSENIQTAVVAASTYKALMSGYDTGIENSYVNVWRNDDKEHTPKVLESLRYCMHPLFEIPANDDVFTTDTQYVNACCMVSGNELPLIMGLPKKSIKGVTVLDIAQFGRNVQYTNHHSNDAKNIKFGQVFNMGTTDGTRVNLDLNSFTSHCFITGSTGSGKSNTTYRILDEMIANKIPFLVVEPAKGEYKRYYGGLPGINVFCTNPDYFSMLHINPFRFPDKIHVLEHLDRLIEIFNACWPLYAAMPAILKDAFEQAYVSCGWDLERSIYIPNDKPKYPTFKDIIDILPKIINSSSYSSDSKGDYTGSLVTRVKSLTNGIIGQVMCSNEDIDDPTLFDESTIVDLSRVSSLETKSLLMGVIILKLQEYRMCTSKENQPLRHVTVLEEAHNILKRSSGASSDQESADVQGKSVEMISSAIAEMRTYGEGFIIVDQSPTAVDVSAIKNTNTKVIMRLPDYDDCKIAGRAIGLNDKQIHEISRFPVGVAAVYQNNWAEAVLTKIDRSREKYGVKDEVLDPHRLASLKGDIASVLIDLYNEKKLDNGITMDILKRLQGLVRASGIPEGKKKEMFRRLAHFRQSFSSQKLNRGMFANNLAYLMDCDSLFSLMPIKFSKDYSELKSINKTDIDRKDRRAIRAWHKKLRNNVGEYVKVDDNHIKSLLFLLIIYMMNKHTDKNKYKLLFFGFYGKK